MSFIPLGGRRPSAFIDSSGI